MGGRRKPAPLVSAFPVVESYDITTQPYARDFFSPAALQRLFAHPSATLRPLNDNERSAIAALPLRVRATSNAWIAHKFVMHRQRTGTLTCDKCPFDPAALVNGTGVRPRTLLDVHHLHPLEEGRRVTTLADFALLCPTCHRFEHALLRASSTR